MSQLRGAKLAPPGMDPPQRFAEFVVGVAPDGLKSFWQVLRDQPWLEHHPSVEDNVELDCLIPVCLHGDEAEYLDDQELYILSWSGALTHGHSPRTRFPVCTLPSRRLFVENAVQISLQVILRFIVWSFNIMLAGLWPAAGPDGTSEVERVAYRTRNVGKRLAGRYRAAYFGVRGDLKWDQHAHNWHRSYLHKAICRECRAEDDGRTNFAADGWMSTVVQWSDCITEQTSVRGLHPYMAWWDLLHVLFVKGVACDLVGSVLLLMAGGPAATKPHLSNELAAAYHKFRQWVRDHKLQTTHDGFTLNSLHLVDGLWFPFLGGKAADVRLVLQWLACSVDPPLPEEPTLAVRSLARFVYTLRRAGILLSKEAQEAAYSSGWLFIQEYHRIAAAAQQRGEGLYEIRHKTHYFVHIVQRLGSCPINPQISSCWSDEDFMGRIGAIASMCHRRSAPERTLQRYLLLLMRELRLEPTRSAQP